MFQSTNSPLTKTLQRSEKNEKMLMEENKKCKREIANLVENNLKLQKENGLLKEELKIHRSSNNKINELQEIISALQKQQLEKVESLSRIQEQNSALQKEIQTLCDKNAIQTIWREQQARDLEGFDQLKKEAKLMRIDINQLKHQNEYFGKKDQENQNKIGELQNLLQNECTKNKNIQEALNNEKLSRHHFSEKTLADLNNKVQSLQTEKDGLLGELKKSRNHLKSFKKDNEMLTEEIRRESLKNKKLSELVEVRTAERDKLKREQQSKDLYLQNMEEEAVKARKIIDGMQLELEKLYHAFENDRERNTGVVSSFNQENQCLKKEVKEREDNEQKLEIQVSSFKDQVRHIEGKLCDVQTDFSKSEKENALLKKVKMSLENEISEIKAELETIKSENQSLNDQLEQMRKQMEEMEVKEKEKLSVADRELTKVRDTVSVIEVERRKLAKELEECQQVVLQNSRKLNQLENEKSMLEEKEKKLTEESSNLHEENKKLRQFESYWLFLSDSIIGPKND